jgi:hypothetical protein
MIKVSQHLPTIRVTSITKRSLIETDPTCIGGVVFENGGELYPPLDKFIHLLKMAPPILK